MIELYDSLSPCRVRISCEFWPVKAISTVLIDVNVDTGLVEIDLRIWFTPQKNYRLFARISCSFSATLQLSQAMGLLSLCHYQLYSIQVTHPSSSTYDPPLSIFLSGLNLDPRGLVYPPRTLHEVPNESIEMSPRICEGASLKVAAGRKLEGVWRVSILSDGVVI